MHRAVKDWLKEVFFWMYKLGIRMGVFILPVHYYSSEPNILELERTADIWAKSSSLPGVKVDLDEQIGNLRKVSTPFRHEYIGNNIYKTAIAAQYGPGFGFIEAELLHSVIRYYQPSRVIEIGSGRSTYCILTALKMNARDNGRTWKMTCIEPHPSARLLDLVSSEVNVRIISQPVQSVPLELFADLSVNDLLFIDSSHVVKAGSDVNHVILEVLPELNRGVLIHFHDICFPYDYQRDLLRTFLHNNETSLLRAFLIFNQEFSMLFCLSHLHYERREDLKAIFPDYHPQSDWNGLAKEKCDPDIKHFPSSLWLQVCN